MFCSTPEFCFAQMARETPSEITLAKLGYEFCGTYSLDPSQPVGFVGRQAIASTGSIDRFLQKCPDKKLGRARRALGYVADDSASPMETFLALTFGLPARLGGYGLGIPQMNAEVEIPEKLEGQVTHGRYHCDLFWPNSKVGLEYNSKEFHLNEEAVERDTSRVNNLLAAGVATVAVTRLHVRDPRKMDTIAHSLAAHMGKRLRTNYEDIEARRIALRKELLAKDPWA